MGIILKRIVKVREVGKGAKAISVPPNSTFQKGDELLQIYSDDFIVVIPKSKQIDEYTLTKIMGMNNHANV